MAIVCSIRWLAVVLLTLSSITTIHGQTCTQTGQLRLFESASFNSGSNFSTMAGRVEICVGGVWGTIAADSIAIPWSEKNAQVACIQLGFTGALNAVYQRTVPFVERSTSPIHLSAVMCDGTESRIIDCPHSNSTQNVDHGFDAYIVCRPRSQRYSLAHPAGLQSGDVRLFGDTRNGYGAVQIYTITLGWQGICPDRFWTRSDASTICRQLGYNSGSVSTPIDAIRGPGGRPLSRSLYDAKCPGRSSDDITTDLCSFRIESSVARCAAPEGSFAALRCSYVSDQSVRLIGGSHNQEGIVEIAYNGRWGMLCNGRFQLTDAQSVCQGLGFGTDDARVMSISSSSQVLGSASNLRPIWLNNLDCSSSDDNLPSCVREQNLIGFANCRSSSIAAVDCGDPPPLTPGQIAGITLGVLAFVAIVVPLLVICLDENKKKATIAKLEAAKARIAQIRIPRCPRPRCPKPRCPRLPRRQPRRQSARAPSAQPSTSEPPLPEPLNAEPSQTAAPVAPQVPAVPSAPQAPEPPQDSSHFTKIDAPPPYPGGPAYPPPVTVSVNYQGYPPPTCSNPAYPPPVALPGVYPTDDAPHPAELKSDLMS